MKSSISIRWGFLVMLWLAAISSLVFGESVARVLSVEFYGNHEVSERRLRGWMGLKRGDSWIPGTLSDKLQSLLENIGRFDKVHD